MLSQKRLDEIGDEIHSTLLDEARTDVSTERTAIAVLILTLPDGNEKVVTHYAEYGDDEGTAKTKALRDEMQKFVRPGESLRIRVVDVDSLALGH